MWRLTDCVRPPTAPESSVSSGAAAAGAGRFSVEAVATQVAAKAAGRARHWRAESFFVTVFLTPRGLM